MFFGCGAYASMAAYSHFGLPPLADEAARVDAVGRRALEQRMAPEQAVFLYDLVDVAPPAELR